MGKRDTLAPPYPLRQETDYRAKLAVLFREWRRDSVRKIKGLIGQVKDDLIGDFFSVLRAAWQAAVNQFEPTARIVFERVDNRQSTWWRGFVSKVTAVPVEAIDPFISEPWLADEISSKVAENVRLIRGIGDDCATRVQAILRNGVRSGVGSGEIARQINEVFDTSEARCLRIARDQVGSFHAALTEQRQRDAGIEEYIWSTSKDSRVRKEHAAREGEVFQWSSPPADGHPGQPVNCRCVAKPNLPAKIYQFPVQERYRNRAA